jgi:hypothetical protein
VTVLLRVRQNQKTPSLKLNRFYQEREENRRQRTWGWKFAGTRITEIQNIWFILSHLYHVNG